jgi:hypothetical protein
MAHSPTRSSSSSDSGVSDFLDALHAVSLVVVQTVNIHNHVPIVLDLSDSNYSQWCCFLDSVLGKFGLPDMSYRRHPFTTATPNGATSTAASSIGCTPQSPKSL